MGRNSDHVGVGQRELAGGLCAIGEEHAALFPHGLGDLVQRLQYARLVIGMLNRDERPFALYSRRVHQASRADRQPHRIRRGTKDGVMLDGADVSRPRLRTADRKSVVSGKSVSVRVDLGGRRTIQKKKYEYRYDVCT